MRPDGWNECGSCFDWIVWKTGISCGPCRLQTLIRTSPSIQKPHQFSPLSLELWKAADLPQSWKIAMLPGFQPTVAVYHFLSHPSILIRGRSVGLLYRSWTTTNTVARASEVTIADPPRPADEIAVLALARLVRWFQPMT